MTFFAPLPPAPWKRRIDNFEGHHENVSIYSLLENRNQTRYKDPPKWIVRGYAFVDQLCDFIEEYHRPRCHDCRLNWPNDLWKKGYEDPALAAVVMMLGDVMHCKVDLFLPLDVYLRIHDDVCHIVEPPDAYFSLV